MNYQVIPNAFLTHSLHSSVYHIVKCYAVFCVLSTFLLLFYSCVLNICTIQNIGWYTNTDIVCIQRAKLKWQVSPVNNFQFCDKLLYETIRLSVQVLIEVLIMLSLFICLVGVLMILPVTHCVWKQHDIDMERKQTLSILKAS